MTEERKMFYKVIDMFVELYNIEDISVVDVGMYGFVKIPFTNRRMVLTSLILI